MACGPGREGDEEDASNQGCDKINQLDGSQKMVERFCPRSLARARDLTCYASADTRIDQVEKKVECAEEPDQSVSFLAEQWKVERQKDENAKIRCGQPSQVCNSISARAR